MECKEPQREVKWPLHIPPIPSPPKENWPISQLLAVIENKVRSELGVTIGYAAAATAAAKSLQSCLTLCDPTEGSPPGSPVPGILQARTLEWAATSFSSAWEWKVKVKSLSRAQLLATPCTAAYQAPLSLGFSRQEHWSGLPLHCLLQCIRVKSESEVAQSCPTLRDPMDCSPPGSSMHGIFPGKSTGVGCHCLLLFQGTFYCY